VRQTERLCHPIGLAKLPIGRACDQPVRLVQVFQTRFGSADLRDLKPELLRLGPDGIRALDRTKDVASILDRAELSELSRKYELKRTLKKGLGMRMRRAPGLPIHGKVLHPTEVSVGKLS
jgi:hypothetical protein